MAVPARWTLDSFDDEPEAGDLPRPADITRAALADPDFDVEAFLNAHSQFRTLRDTQRAVLEWEQALYEELVAVMNANFRDFVASAASLASAKSYLDSINGDILRFTKLAARVADGLERSADGLDQELARHKRLCVEEGKARQLLLLFDLLDELETALHDTEIEDAGNLESLARTYVAIVAVAETARDVKAVNLLRISIQSAQYELLESLNAAISAAGAGEPKLELVEAREWVHATRLEPARV